ncbi:glycoside hydrolase family 2 TIM barrel-domain containing protein [Faecalimonas sp.]
MKKKGITALLLATAMLGTSIPYGTLTVQAKSSLKPAAEIKADVNKTKFTHKEWKGINYKDVDGKRVTGEDVFGINREDAGVSIIPYQDTSSAASAVWDYNARENSEYFQMLTGKNQKWDLTVVQNQEQAQKFMGEHGFMMKNYQKQKVDGWKSVELPKSWTRDNFDFSIYTNFIMPWQMKYDPVVLPPHAPSNYNPVGLYRKTFTINDKMLNKGRRVYLNFAGVESAYYVYVNGKEVGYSEDSYSPHHFDVTDYLKRGKNVLAVKVHKFCDGTWFEDQDMIYDGGIFRDVYLTSAPLMQIKDYTVRTDLDTSYKNATLHIAADIRNLSNAVQNGYKIQVKALDKAGNDILGGVSVPIKEVASTKTKTVELQTKVVNPKLWSAENPNLYALILTLIDENGNTVETVSTQLGFREIEFTRTEVDKHYRVTTKKWEPIKINGKRLLMKGANRHDTDPFYGKAVPQETMREDVKLMKQNNLNAVRTSHYSNDDYFYWLCNSYGLYMIGETNLESHNLMFDNVTKGLFYELTMDRTKTAYQRLKNNPAIVVWSIGNEMVYTSDPNASKGMFKDMIWYFKNNDPTRPVHSEGQNDKMGTDMGSNMYPSVATTQGRAGEGKIPYVLCEYAHGMGNSIGNLKEYWDAIRSADNMLGAFVWDWVDQSRAVDLDKVDYKHGAKAKWDYYATASAHKNLYTDEIKGKFYGYGGDWGDFPNDNSFCENGLVSPDRDPQPELMEVKYQYKNFWMSAETADLDARQIKVFNESNFKNLNEYDVTWQLLENGKEIQSGKVENPDVAPQTTGKIKVPFTMPEQISAGNEYYLNISVSLKENTEWAKKGTEMAWEQIPVPVFVEQAVPQVSDKAVTVNETENAFEVKGEKFAFSIDKATGTMKNYTYNGNVLVQQGPVPNFWRGLVENDKKAFDQRWKNAAKNIKVKSVEATKNEAGQNVITATMVFPYANLTKETIVYTINGNGEVTIKMSVDAKNKGMGGFIRVGSMMTLPEGYENVTWYGNGPVETFNDRKTNARQGIYKNTVSEFFYPYLKVDDTGNLTDVNWISVKSDKNDTGLLIAAKDKVEASALHFTPDDLNAVTHVYGLTPRKETILSVNYGSLGTGGATCGPEPLPQYQLPANKVYEWEFTMIPVDKNANTETLGNMAKSYHKVSSFDKEGYDKTYAQSLIAQIDSFVVYDYSQLKEVEELQATVNAMTKEQVAIVNKDKDRSKLVEDYVKEIKALENKETYIQDSSKNALEIPYESSAKFKKNGETVVMNGKLGVPFNEVLNPVLEGNKSFTVEAKVTPTGSLDYNMFAGKGDDAFALRSREDNYIDFHIYAGGKWRSIEYKMTSEEKANWIGKEHQIVGVYDDANHKIQLYADGKLMKETNTKTNEGVAHSDYDFTIGGCPSTDRASAADFSSIRIYAKALTADEVAAQNSEKLVIQPKDENVALWIEMKDIKHRDKENIDQVRIDPSKETMEVGATKEFTLVTDSTKEKLTGIKWSILDENGVAPEGIEVQYSADNYEKVTVSVSENAKVGNYILRAQNINGKEELTADAQIVVTEKSEQEEQENASNSYSYSCMKKRNG